MGALNYYIKISKLSVLISLWLSEHFWWFLAFLWTLQQTYGCSLLFCFGSSVIGFCTVEAIPNSEVGQTLLGLQAFCRFMQPAPSARDFYSLLRQGLMRVYGSCSQRMPQVYSLVCKSNVERDVRMRCCSVCCKKYIYMCVSYFYCSVKMSIFLGHFWYSL